MKASKYLFFAAIALPLVLSSCRGERFKHQPVHPNMNMDQQERFEPQEKNEFFDDNRAMRKPVDGTVARGKLKADKAFYKGVNKDGDYIDNIPVDLTKSFLYRGKKQYEVFCTPCHGIKGDGNGIIMANNYGYVPAPDFHSDFVRDRNDGYYYAAIANGVRTMPSYATQIDVKDRWAIVAYIRALQKSQNVSEEEIQQYDVNVDSLNQDFAEAQKAEEAKKAKQKQKGGGEVSVERGKTIATNNACNTCHSTDGSRLVGPTWKNLYGSERTLTDGETVVADEEYLRTAIVEPSAQVAEGFAPSMVPYDHLSDSKINSLIAYIKSLSENAE
ncbi:c-type cytochrome [Fodinibius halophilus]|uniref:C-type cytochrome n=1 Tax=Fodinibius halophilus TaxID=1736908 RepID=A0A6M1T6K8_9BACT|nr:c-type cytochrome [Fodinibius halophilus]NGP88253.1 c-type cytochrome [Fodinibius halophilus]